MPPIERVSQKIEIEGFQRGNIVNLSWIMPTRNASGKSIQNINRVDVYRLAEPLASSLTLSEEEFASRSTLIATLPVSDKDFGLKKFTYLDKLEFAGQAVRLRYAVRFVNASGQKAAYSNFLLFEPTAQIAGVPETLQIRLNESAINLNWAAPSSNIDGSKPANILGFDIYRSASEKETAVLLNKNPVSDTSYSDPNFEYGKNYYYFVRTVSLSGSGEPVESLESNIVNILPLDTFPPAAPTAITIAAAPNNISIFFAANAEKDLAGYRIFRSTEREISPPQWKILTQELLTTNTFQDRDVESGKSYYYYLIAVDKAGNTSQPSEIVFETLP